MNLAMVPVRLRIWHMVRIKTSLRFHSEPSLAGESVLTLISKVGSLFSIPIRFSDRLLMPTGRLIASHTLPKPALNVEAET
jgi:hypothetical protein